MVKVEHYARWANLGDDVYRFNDTSFPRLRDSIIAAQNMGYNPSGIYQGGQRDGREAHIQLTKDGKPFLHRGNPPVLITTSPTETGFAIHVPHNPDREIYCLDDNEKNYKEHDGVEPEDIAAYVKSLHQPYRQVEQSLPLSRPRRQYKTHLTLGDQLNNSFALFSSSDVIYIQKGASLRRPFFAHSSTYRLIRRSRDLVRVIDYAIGEGYCQENLVHTMWRGERGHLEMRLDDASLNRTPAVIYHKETKDQPTLFFLRVPNH